MCAVLQRDKPMRPKQLLTATVNSFVVILRESQVSFRASSDQCAAKFRAKEARAGHDLQLQSAVLASHPLCAACSDWILLLELSAAWLLRHAVARLLWHQVQGCTGRRGPGRPGWRCRVCILAVAQFKDQSLCATAPRAGQRRLCAPDATPTPGRQ